MNALKYRLLATIAVVVSIAAMVMMSGCTGDSSPAPGASTRPALAAKGGAQLWAENCMRCHNMRSPSTHSDAEWAVIVHHMRLRAGLTGEEQRIITEFLQSAN